MNNEIKFRAWDKFQNKYVFTGFHICGEVCAFGGMESVIDETWKERSAKLGYTSTIEAWNDFEFEQYTGLNDSNNVDIYHKDKIKITGILLDKVIYIKEYIVEQNFGGWGFYDELQRWQWLYQYLSSFDGVKTEVIGNSHDIKSNSYE